jgi:hypothetical protein
VGNASGRFAVGIAISGSGLSLVIVFAGVQSQG